MCLTLPRRSPTRTLSLAQAGDFDSFESAQYLVDELPALDAAGVKVVAVVIGTPAAARNFAQKTNFPVDRLYADERAEAVAALGCAPGWGREGGPGAWAAKLPFVNGYVKLLVMCAGVGSPGTLKEVIGGYFGSKDEPQVFNTGSNVDLEWKNLFDITGKGFRRPFELATLRLNNMIDILGDWEALAPADPDLLVQRGAALVLDGDETLYRHDDQGILGYAPPKRLARKALAEDPRAPLDAKAICREAAATRKVDSEDLYQSIAQLEKESAKEVSLEALNGKWKLQWTTGTAKVSANVNRAGDGSYFPVTAVQSFDAERLRIRNGIYAGPLSFFFDGPFRWIERKDGSGLLEFTFNRVSLALGPLGPWSQEIDGGAWDSVKAAEEKASGGQGKVTSTKSSKKKSTPFFKILFADGSVIAARGRGGGLALWQRVGEPEVADS